MTCKQQELNIENHFKSDHMDNNDSSMPKLMNEYTEKCIMHRLSKGAVFRDFVTVNAGDCKKHCIDILMKNIETNSFNYVKIVV
jgi:hypothetical protein